MIDVSEKSCFKAKMDLKYLSENWKKKKEGNENRGKIQTWVGLKFEA